MPGSHFHRDELLRLPHAVAAEEAEEAVAEQLAKAIAATAHTGLMGDGKIFITEAAWPETIEF